MKKFGNFVCSHKWTIVIITILLLIPSLIGMYKTKVNYDILVYLPEDIETLKGENILTNDFNMGAFSITIVDNMADKDLIKLEEKIRNIEGVNKVISINDLTGTTIPLEILPDDILNKVMKGNSKLMLITFNHSTSDDITLDAVNEIRKITKDTCKVGGMSAMVLDTKDLFNSEMTLYVVIAVIFCILVLIFSLDSYLVPFLLITNIGVAILFNMGSNIFFGDICYITKAISSVLQLGVTTDFSIFLYHKYEKAKKQYKNRNVAMSNAIHDTLVSVFGSSLTTIAGFLALCTMNLTLGKDIGIVMAKGVLFGLICVITLFPALLLVFDKWIEKTRHKVWLPKFNRIKDFIMNHYVLIFSIFLVFIIPAYIFQSKTSVYYNLDKSIPDNYGYTISTKALKEDYNIVSQEIILVDSKMSSYKINALVDEINDIDGVDFIISPSMLSKYGISDDILDDDLKKVYDSGKYKIILINSKYDIATNELNNQIDKINKVVDKYDKKAIVAGEGPLMKDLVTITDEDFHNVNYTSIVVIFILMLLVLKSISLPVLLVTAIEFAIFVNMGVPYLTGTSIPFIASVVIGTIQLGATIDYAILITTKYLEERKNSIDKRKAVRSALDNSIHSIFVSAMCFFAATIGVGIVSKIDMIGSLCTLIARGAIISMFVVLFVVPSILLIFDKIITKTTLGFKKGGNIMKKFYKTICLVLCAGMIFSPVSTFALSKEETVYVKLNSSGKVKKTIVSEHLINEEKSDVIHDYTKLKNIKNINGDEKFSLKDNVIRWEANGNDIYYQGETDEKLPISAKVSYLLNGKEMKPQKMIGKKGHVSIIIQYTNNLVNYVNGNTLYTPFVVITETVLPTKNNSNVTVTNGKVISTGTNNVITGISSPGLYDSLKISSLQNFDTITIEYDTTKFSKEAIYSISTSKLLDDSDFTQLNDINFIYNQVNTLSNGANQIVDGSKKLLDGTTQIKNGSIQLNQEIQNAYEGVIKIKNAVDSSIQLSQSDKSSALDEETISSIKNQAIIGATLTEEQKNLIGNKAVLEIENTINSNISILESKGINGDLVNICSSNQIADEYISICTNNTSYIAQYKYLKDESINSMMKEVARSTAINTAEETAKSTAALVSENVSLSVASKVKEVAMQKTITSLSSLSNSLGELSNGLKLLNEGSNSLVNGISQLSDGVNNLYIGSNTFNELGIKKVSNLVNGTFKSKTSTIQQLTKLSNNYESFGGKNSNIHGNTKFIMIIE